MRRVLLVVVGLLFIASAPAWADADDDKRTLGDPKAPVTMIEYASMTCPHCGHFATEILPEIRKQFVDTGKLKIIFRDFPLNQPAVQGAMLARCAPPERFWGFIDAMFRGQRNWAFSADAVAPGLARIAKLGGLSQEQFDACMANKDIENQVLNQRLEGAKQFNIEATPTFIINGRKMTDINGKTVDVSDSDYVEMVRKYIPN
jgi:protein-disulfide isomerase